MGPWLVKLMQCADAMSGGKSSGWNKSFQQSMHSLNHNAQMHYDAT